MLNPTIITCALTGAGDTVSKNPAVPITPKQIADQAIDAAKAGAAVVHIHVRDPATGAPSVEFGHYSEVVERIRGSSTDVVVNLTSGPGSLYAAEGLLLHPAPGVNPPMTPQQRLEHILKLKPEVCSLDVATLNFGRIAMVNLVQDLEVMGRAIRDANIKPEIEVFDLGHIRLAKHLLEVGVLKSPAFFQFCLGVPWGAPAQSDVLQVMRAMLPPGALWSAFGISHDQFKIAAAACELGGHVRVGLEDNLYIAKGQLASSNAQLVEEAARVITRQGARPASPAEARKILLGG
ncbi:MULTISPECIES: 3-keto-5-aminohexanoate cleavage protein [Bradyrhizobium]|uniref:3-keto-5-aminohexanoate cleavage protein n=1 Tax=Bradyrhizobium TaxID=374 RepID=UPI000D64A7E0|nr:MULTISPECIES: 3-keto-5-aminohexanoate cleavage protein [Bradyrhizobium]MCA1414349.1 3-keto-5-aminohexanoate cleavage protein [Bradyrhizobium sp. NBAIM20]MCA1465605.1 3-keto-5-aminohexanoate cleavage protein [Bradyrhizobium sp. NBAIM18]MCA1530066.1 3-keto-5-aminohexanoate cleavage protein [Bradyrhizobium yuanmingense]PWE75492.1 NADPH:quinone reductase [Bradyrhizobium sp. SUTN9-2]